MKVRNVVFITALFIFCAGLVTQAPAVDQRRLERAIDNLGQIIDKARSTNSAHPQMIIDLEAIHRDLTYAVSQGEGYGGGYNDYDSGYGYNDQPQRPHTIAEPPRHEDNDSIPSRNKWKITGDMNNLRNMQDKNRGTRADTGTPNYGGRKIYVDLGKLCTIRKIIQDHGESKEDYPRQYKVLASSDGMQWNEIWRGGGSKEGHSVEVFSPVRARFVRVEVTQERGKGKWWSIHELGIE